MSGFKNLFSFGKSNKTQPLIQEKKDEHTTEVKGELITKSKTFGLFESSVQTARTHRRTGSVLEQRSSETLFSGSATSRSKTGSVTIHDDSTVRKLGSQIGGFLTSRRKGSRRNSIKFLSQIEGIETESLYKGYMFHYEESMKEKSVKLLFGKYLKEIHNEEQLLFLEEAEKFRAMVKKSDKERYNRSKDIISRFIVVFAENEINISNTQRKDIVQKFDECSPSNTPTSLFDELLSDVTMSLKIDSFKRFVASKQFREFCDNCDEVVFLKFATKYEVPQESPKEENLIPE